MTSLDERSAAVESVVKTASGVLAGIAGAGSLAYLAGFISRRTYFETLQAPWLLAQMSNADLLFASFAGLFPLTLLVATAIVQVSEMAESQRKFTWGMLLTIAAAITCLFVERLGARSLTIDSRAAIVQLSSILLTFAAVFIAKLALNRYMAQPSAGNIRIAHALLAIAVIAFIFVPMLSGRADALAKFGTASRLPVAAIKHNGRVEKLSVLLFTSDKIYVTVMPRTETVPLNITVVKWDDVVSVEGVR